jgi:hypothetical protein
MLDIPKFIFRDIFILNVSIDNLFNAKGSASPVGVCERIVLIPYQNHGVLPLEVSSGVINGLLLNSRFQGMSEKVSSRQCLLT